MKAGLRILVSIFADFSHSLRQLRRAPGFAITVIATLATGIGVSAAMFTVVDRVLLRPLPYHASAQLVEIKEAGKTGPSMFGAPFLDIEQWRERSHSLQGIAFHTYDKPTSFLEGNSGPVQVNTPKVSANLFATLGVEPAMGRDFKDSIEEFVRKGDTKRAVLSDAVWRDGFGADSNILGKVIKLNGNSYTVIGVMPRGFQFPFNPEKPQIWIPIELGESDKSRIKNATPEYRIIARLRNGFSVDAAKAELTVIQAEVVKQYTDPHTRENVTSVEVRAYSESVVEGNVREALLALLAASGVLWLIACVNVTSLMLARAAVRRHEVAVRAALGASHWRIARQLLVEGLLLSGVASLFALGLIFLALSVFERELATQFNVHVGTTPNIKLISCLFGLTVLSAIISSVWPSFVAVKTSIDPLLRQGGMQGGGRIHHRARGLLVISQVAMSLTLLIACGLLLRTIYALKHVSLGFRTDHVIVADLVIPAYKFDGRNMTTELYQPLVERVERMPGVQAASLTTAVPLGKRFPILFTFAADELDPESLRIEDLVAQFRAVGPGLQRVFGFGMLMGRFFNEGDTAGSPPVVVVNRAFVRAYFGDNREPGKIVGQELLSYGNEKPAHIIGVLDDERQASVVAQSQPEIEVCIPQITPDSGFYRVAEGLAMNLAVRTERSPGSFVPELREVLRSASPELAGTTFTTMDQVVDDSYGDQRITARLLQIFAGSALLLCVTGLYSLLAYLVTQRTQELGIRFALGAQRQQVIWLVMRQAGWILLVGSVIGLMVSFFAGRMLANLLFGVKASDVLTLTGANMLLMATGLGAAYIPARRAASVDPMQALRTE
ncbi:MAG TPA: ABC transporter permease [Terriglobales bacterium]|nr:ABC transporter permease [Terriglobales bacterium]